MEIVVFCLNALTRACLLLNKLYERYSADSLLPSNVCFSRRRSLWGIVRF